MFIRTRQSCEMQRRLLLHGISIHRGVVLLHQHFDEVRVTPLGREMKGCPAVLGPAIDKGVLVDQQLTSCQAPRVRCQVKRGFALVVKYIHSRVVLKQYVHNQWMAIRGGNAERRPA